jgi:hypothetical protein
MPVGHADVQVAVALNWGVVPPVPIVADDGKTGTAVRLLIVMVTAALCSVTLFNVAYTERANDPAVLLAVNVAVL